MMLQKAPSPKSILKGILKLKTEIKYQLFVRFIFDEERKRHFQFDLFEQECRNSDKRENSTKHSASVLQRPSLSVDDNLESDYLGFSLALARQLCTLIGYPLPA